MPVINSLLVKREGGSSVVPPSPAEANINWYCDPGNAGNVSFHTERRQPEAGDYVYNYNNKPVQGIVMKMDELEVPYFGWLQVESYDSNTDSFTISANGVIVRDVSTNEPTRVHYEAA